MSQKSAMLVTGQNMASIINEAFKIQGAFTSRGHSCDLYFFNRDHPDRTRLRRYDLAIWWTPFLPMFIRRQGSWLRLQKENVAVSYYTIEGIVKGLWRGDSWLKWQYIVTPSLFVKGCIEEMGFSVKEVIPHQIDKNLIIDYAYGHTWRERFPRSKRVLLYNGSQILRKALPKLRQAIDILSKKRSDFVMVFHTDDVKQPFHTLSRDLEGVNTVVEREFPHLPIEKAMAKMFYADIIVHPAVTEGFGLPILEALNLGKPLVCINAHGVNEIANPSNSFMVQKVKPTSLEWKGYISFKAVDYDAQDLADQIELCLNASNSELESKKVNALATAKKYHNTYERFTLF